MQVERRDGQMERAVLIAMAVNRSVLGAVAARWDGEGLFPSRWCNLAGGWAVDHYRKYKRPPGPSLATYFDKWAETGRDKDVIAAMEIFLGGLDAEYETLKKTLSPDFLIDAAGDLFNRAAADRLRERVAVDLENGDVKKALERIKKFNPVELGNGSGFSPLGSESEMIAAFENVGEVLIAYPDALGKFFGTSLGRDSFIAFMGAEKSGKSFWLMDLAVRAVEQHRNTAFFEVGDMSQNQVLRRFGVRFAEQPIHAGPVTIPVSIDSGDPPAVGTRIESFPDDLTAEMAWNAVRRAGRRYGADRLRLSVHPNSSISVAGIEAQLEGWARDGWTPDVVVIDYADILAPLSGTGETRDQINATWKALRALSQRFHCLVVTATQTDAASYVTKLLKRSNFSEDKRKYAHVTGMVGINRTTEDKDAGLYRLNFVVLRELEFSEEKCVWTAACLSLGNPAMLSVF